MGSLHVDEGERTIGRTSPKTPGQSATVVHATTFSEQKANVDINEQAKPTHQNIIRLAPPLVISEEQIQTALRIIGEAIDELPSLKGDKEAKVLPEGEKNVHIGVDN